MRKEYKLYLDNRVRKIINEAVHNSLEGNWTSPIYKKDDINYICNKLLERQEVADICIDEKQNVYDLILYSDYLIPYDNDLRETKARIITMPKKSNTGSVIKEWESLSKNTLKAIKNMLDEFHEEHMLVNTMDFHIETLDATPKGTMMNIDNFQGVDEEGHQVIMRIASVPADKMCIEVKMTMQRKNNKPLMDYLDHHEQLYKSTYARKKILTKIKKKIKKILK